MLEFMRPIVIFMVDCTQGITHRDMTLLQEMTMLGLPMIFALNKADLVKKEAIDAMVKGAQSYLDFAKQIQRPARFTKNRTCKIMYATQIEVDAPTFMVFVNHKARANFSFKKWIENVLRRAF